MHCAKDHTWRTHKENLVHLAIGRNILAPFQQATWHLSIHIQKRLKQQGKPGSKRREKTKAMSDAFFVPNQSDITFVREALVKSGMSEDDINAKPWAYFKSRVRGFSISPRFADALLFDFIHRWNHDFDIRVLGLSKDCATFFDGWEIEEEVEPVSMWEDYEGTIHPLIECTKDFVPTGEQIGVVAGSFLEEESSISLAATRVLADSMNTGEWNQEINGVEIEPELQLTDSAAWVAAKFGRKREIEKVSQPAAQAPTKKARQKRRCTLCGHSSDWALYRERHSGAALRIGVAPNNICTAGFNEICKGFPAGSKRIDKIPRHQYNQEGL